MLTIRVLESAKYVIHIQNDTYRKLPKEEQERRLVKAKKSRIIPIHVALMECIENQKADRVSDYFLSGKDGRAEL